MSEITDKIKFNEHGLVPVVAQCSESKDVLMMAWMNEEAIEKTLETGDVYYWSRTRKALWRKGETSGHTQKLKDFLVDCDNDTILVQVQQQGLACHTGRKSCFYNAVRNNDFEEVIAQEKDPEEIYGDKT